MKEEELFCEECHFLERDLQWEEWDCSCPTRPAGKSSVSIKARAPDWCPRRKRHDRLLKPRGWNRATPRERAELEAGCTCQEEGISGAPTRACPIHNAAAERLGRVQTRMQTRLLEQLERLSNECPGAGAPDMTPVAAARQAYINAMRVVRHGGK